MILWSQSDLTSLPSGKYPEVLNLRFVVGERWANSKEIPVWKMILKLVCFVGFCCCCWHWKMSGRNFCNQKMHVDIWCVVEHLDGVGGTTGGANSLIRWLWPGDGNVFLLVQGLCVLGSHPVTSTVESGSVPVGSGHGEWQSVAKC